ncbi:MAG: glycosyltransferase family 4 protein [Elusimicrobia bacterium]|nr:glycosyltransferase family 4 protein [Elusimicrobiota bacterium]
MKTVSPAVNYAYLCAFRDIVGGGQAGMLLHFKHADRARFTPLLVCPGEGEVSRRAAELGIETVFFDWPRPGVLSLPAVLAGAMALRALAAKRKIALLHADTLELAAIGGLAAICSPLKVVFHARVSDGGGMWDRLVPALCDRIICVSKAAARRFPASGKVRVIYNGVERVTAPTAEQAAECRRELGLLPEQVVAGYCGQLIESKGLSVLLRAFALLKSGFPSARLLLSGRGDTDGLKKLAADLGIEGQTLFTGFRADNASVRACIDIFTLPGLHEEGLPRTILEGMALGRPSVLTPVGGSAEAIVDGESGFFVPPGNASALAEKLGLLLRDSGLRARMGEAAKKRMETLFEAGETTRGMEAVYQELLG